MINLVVTSKPVDGLFLYSYEYCSFLNENDIDARVVVICHRDFTPQDYLSVIQQKYIHCKHVYFDNFVALDTEVAMVLGRSMITLSYKNWRDYTQDQQRTLTSVFKGKVLSVYSENHPQEYPKALEFFKPTEVVDLCDKEVYPNGVGKHFEKRINFSIYKPYEDNVQFKYLFFGTTPEYYEAVEKVLPNYSDHGILTYDADYVNIKNNNIFVPVENVLGIFDTYVYTKSTFDPAPRIVQECKYFGKNMIYARDKDLVDGGSVYWTRDIKQPDIESIVGAL